MAVIPFDQREGFIWMNGDFVPWRDAKVHVLTHALHYASAVFEGERAYGGVIFKLREHTERLFLSAEMLDMKIPYSVAEIDDACRAALKKQGTTLTVGGVAESNNRISSLMRNLDKSDWFASPNLKTIKEDPQNVNYGPQASTFNLTFVQTNPNKVAEGE